MADEPLPVYDFDETPSVDWARIAGVIVGSIVLACVLALLVAGTVRAVTELWP